MSSLGLLCSGRLHSQVILVAFLPGRMFQEVFLSPFFLKMQKEVGQSHNIFLKFKNCQWVATKMCNLQTDSSSELGWNNHCSWGGSQSGREVNSSYPFFLPFISFHSSFIFCPFTFTWSIFLITFFKSINPWILKNWSKVYVTNYQFSLVIGMWTWQSEGNLPVPLLQQNITGHCFLLSH